MRVLIIHNQLWAHYKARLFSEIARQASSLNLTILVVQVALAERSRTHLGMPDPAEHQYPYELLYPSALEDVGFLAKISKIIPILRRFKPQVVNLTGYYDPAMWVVMLYCRCAGIKLVMSNESTAQDHHRSGWKESIKRFLVSQFDGFFCFGTPSVAYLQTLGVPIERIFVRNAAVIDDHRIQLEHKQAKVNFLNTQRDLELKPLNFIYTGRLISPKNLPTLIRAFAAAKNQSKDTRWGLILLGEGDQKEALERLAREEQIPDIRFLPGVAWYEVPRFLALANVYVLPSTSEPWGLVVNEAMVCQMPVLVSERCGCATDLVVPGENGFRFAPTNTADLSGKLAWFIRHEAALDQMGARSADIIKAFSVERAAQEMLWAFTRLISLKH